MLLLVLPGPIKKTKSLDSDKLSVSSDEGLGALKIPGATKSQKMRRNASYTSMARRGSNATLLHQDLKSILHGINNLHCVPLTHRCAFKVCVYFLCLRSL